MTGRSDVRERILELGPWLQPFTLDGWNTWEIAPHPVYPSDPAKHLARWHRIEAALPDITGWSVLDIGCLEGYNATRFTRLGATVDAIDNWPEAIERARFVAEILETGLQPRLGDAYETTGAYDLVVMTNVLYMLPDPVGAIGHAASLAPRLLVWCRLDTPTAHLPEGSWIPSRSELEEVLEGAGFTSLTKADSGDRSSAIYLAERLD